MRLCYRGINYEYVPPAVRVTEGEIGGEYRGASWRFHIVEEIPLPQPMLHLIYRGVSYTTGDTPPALEKASGVSPHIVPPTHGLGKILSASRKLRKGMDEVAQTHLSNIRRSLEHRLQVAKEKGDRELVRLLETESEQIV